MGRENRFKNLQTRLNELIYANWRLKRFKIILASVSHAYHVDYKSHMPQNKPKFVKISQNGAQNNVHKVKHVFTEPPIYSMQIHALL